MPETGDSYFDRQEVRRPDEREAMLFNALPGLLRHAVEATPYYQAAIADVAIDRITDREALSTLPLLRKRDLIGLHGETPPFGGLCATPIARLGRLFASPGPIFDPEGARGDYWRFARAMFAAGFRPGDLVYNTFSYHLTPAGFMADGGARALGCPVIPGGTGQTELQANAIHALRPVAYVGTPSYLRILLDKMTELGLRSGFAKALVSGEAFTPDMRAHLSEAHGIDAYQCYATADLGLIAYESRAREGLIQDEAVILEIVRPGTGEPVPDGEVGEVVVTAFNPDYPLIRFATGDLSAIMAGSSPCGRTNRRIEGWMGRADQTAKVRGMFVHPEQVAAIGRRHPGLGRLRLVVESEGGQDRLRLMCETDTSAEGAAAVAETVRAVTGLRAEVEPVAPNSLAVDGKVIDDRRG